MKPASTTRSGSCLAMASASASFQASRSGCSASGDGEGGDAGGAGARHRRRSRGRRCRRRPRAARSSGSSRIACNVVPLPEARTTIRAGTRRNPIRRARRPRRPSSAAGSSRRGQGRPAAGARRAENGGDIVAVVVASTCAEGLATRARTAQAATARATSSPTAAPRGDGRAELPGRRPDGAAAGRSPARRRPASPSTSMSSPASERGAARRAEPPHPARRARGEPGDQRSRPAAGSGRRAPSRPGSAPAGRDGAEQREGGQRAVRGRRTAPTWVPLPSAKPGPGEVGRPGDRGVGRGQHAEQQDRHAAPAAPDRARERLDLGRDAPRASRRRAARRPPR